jgi:hypothetical protein
MTTKPIIIQNFFRSGGSYLYNVFNEDPNIIGFYEPFHENLSSLEKILKEKNNFLENKKKLNHNNNEFYFHNFPENDEYINLFNSKKFQRHTFLLERNDTSDCINYLNYLISIAQKKNKNSLFKINRLYLNPEIINDISAFKIFLFRDPVSSFWSNINLNLLHPYYYSFKYHWVNNIYPFNEVYNCMIKKNIELIKIKNNSLHFKDRNQLNFHFSAFVLLWLIGLERNFINNYLNIYYNNLSEDKYRNLVIKKINENTGLNINFNNFKLGKLKIYETIPEIIPELKKIIRASVNFKIINENLSTFNINQNFRNTINSIIDD